MRLLVKIWLCAGCLLGIAEWSQARPTEPDTLMRALREAASPTNALIREAYANPATRPDAFGHSLSELSIGYRLQTEEQPTVRQKGDRTDFGYFATEGYRHLSDTISHNRQHCCAKDRSFNIFLVNGNQFV